VVQCAALGAGYLAKLPLKKALSEIAHVPQPGYGPGHGSPAMDRRAQQPGPRHGRESRLPHRLPAPRHADHDVRDQAW
jgi:hypothetical protein